MALPPRCAGSDFSPIFRLLEGYDAHCSSFLQSPHAPIRSFAPKFDVRELNDGYYLDGELPGLDQKNIEIEFTDPRTLVINGRVERAYTTDDFAESQNLPENVNNDSSTTKSRQPTVEDEEPEGNKIAVIAPSKHADSGVVKNNFEPSYHCWISERSIGEFHRTFSFPTRIDQDSVRATLKNGILSIIVPKAQAPKVKKIWIE
jgi:HSP20 family molecular chaperone IbpA